MSLQSEPSEHFAMGIMPPIHSLLSGLPDHLSAALFTGAKPLQLKPDQVLFLAGDPGDGCYRVEDGLLKVTMVSRSGTERILAFLGTRAIVGELSMIDGRPRSASVVTVRTAKLSFLSRAAFEVFSNKHPEIYKSLVTLLASRLRETDAVVAAGSFCRCADALPARCSNWRRILGRMSDQAASLFVRRSVRATSPPWRGSREKMLAVF